VDKFFETHLLSIVVVSGHLKQLVTANKFQFRVWVLILLLENNLKVVNHQLIGITQHVQLAVAA
jgi:hypothetical protein